MTEFIQAVAHATANMRALFESTPLQHNLYLSAKYDAEIWLKREDLGPVRSYKLRGAFNAMRKVIPGNVLFVCASAGNHAQGVALACQKLDVNGKIYYSQVITLMKCLSVQLFWLKKVKNT